MTKLVQRALITSLLVAGSISSFVPAAFAVAGPKCDPGEFCAWAKDQYTGSSVRHNLETANPGACIALDGLVARSFVNRLTKDVTVYQGGTCSTEAEFTTYPKGGTYVPIAPFVVRGIQIWE